MLSTPNTTNTSTTRARSDHDNRMRTRLDVDDSDRRPVRIPMTPNVSVERRARRHPHVRTLTANQLRLHASARTEGWASCLVAEAADGRRSLQPASDSSEQGLSTTLNSEILFCREDVPL